MLSSAVRAGAIAAGISAIGLRPQVSDRGDYVQIETKVPPSASADVWQPLLALLETADTFGLVSSARRGLVATALVRKGVPAPRHGAAATPSGPSETGDHPDGHSLSTRS